MRCMKHDIGRRLLNTPNRGPPPPNTQRSEKTKSNTQTSNITTNNLGLVEDVGLKADVGAATAKADVVQADGLLKGGGEEGEKGCVREKEKKYSKQKSQEIRKSIRQPRNETKKNHAM